MKLPKIIMGLLFCALSTQAMAGTSCDTLVVRDVEKVRIETCDTLQRIVMSGAKDNSRFYYEQTVTIPDTSAIRRTVRNAKDYKVKIVKRSGGKGNVDASPHLFLGLGTMHHLKGDALPGSSESEEYNFKIWPSYEIGLCITADWSPFGKKNVWSIGFGVDWRRFSLSPDYYWKKDAQGAMCQAPYPHSQSDTRSSLSLFSLQVPVLYTHRFDSDGDWALTLGGIVNFNTGAHATRCYQEGGEKFSVETGSIGQRPVTVEAVVMFDMPSFPAIYCKYCPMSFFKSGKGPNIRMINFGFCF